MLYNVGGNNEGSLCHLLMDIVDTRHCTPFCFSLTSFVLFLCFNFFLFIFLVRCCHLPLDNLTITLNLIRIDLIYYREPKWRIMLCGIVFIRHQWRSRINGKTFSLSGAWNVARDVFPIPFPLVTPKWWLSLNQSLNCWVSKTNYSGSWYSNHRVRKSGLVRSGIYLNDCRRQVWSFDFLNCLCMEIVLVIVPSGLWSTRWLPRCLISLHPSRSCLARSGPSWTGRRGKERQQLDGPN